MFELKSIRYDNSLKMNLDETLYMRQNGIILFGAVPIETVPNGTASVAEPKQ